MKKAFLSCIILCLYPIGLFAQDSLYNSDLDTIRSSKHGVIPKKLQSIAGFKIGDSTFHEIMMKLGTAELFRPNRHETDLCYSAKDNNQGLKLIFSSGPMGGWRRVTGFYIISNSSNFKRESHCTILESLNNKLISKFPIRPGISRQKAEEIIGSPTQKDGKVISYYFSDKKNEYDITSGVKIVYQNEIVESVYIFLIESM